MNLNQITIPSLDLEKSVSFYKTLGLHLIVDALPNYARFECPDGDSTFSIHKVDELPKGNGITIYFEDDNLDVLVSSLKQKGITFSQLPEDKSWLWREAHLQDLDGNHIILYKAGTNRKNPPWRIKKD
ncbi:MAG: VOC family protein [Bacteroidetes bacterium]|nr:MAG: VOC family protein [Bacteroidota bacterium]